VSEAAPELLDAEVGVRPADVGDAPGIARVHVRAWQAAYRGLLPDEHLDGLDVGARTQRWAGQLEAGPRPGGLVLVSGPPGEVLAFATAGPPRDDDVTGAELYAIYVDPSAWRSGHGRALLEAVGDALPEGTHELVLWVLAANAPARAFYAAHGFEPDGQRKTVELGGARPEEVRYRRSL